MNAVPQALDFSGSQKMEMLLFWNVFLFCNLHKVFPSEIFFGRGLQNKNSNHCI